MYGVDTIKDVEFTKCYAIWSRVGGVHYEEKAIPQKE